MDMRVCARRCTAGLLIHQAFGHLKWAAFRQHQLLAEELAARIDNRFQAIVRAEETRAVTDYGFLVATGEPQDAFLQRSPISEFPVPAAIPGLVGHFQVDAGGTLTTPLAPPSGGKPEDQGVTPEEVAGSGKTGIVSSRARSSSSRRCCAVASRRLSGRRFCRRARTWWSP